MLLEKIADYAIKEQTSQLPAEVVHHAKRAVIDWYAALLPGSIVTPATLLEQALAEDLDRGVAIDVVELHRVRSRTVDECRGAQGRAAA